VPAIQPGNTLPDFKTYFSLALGTGKTILPASAEMAECVATKSISCQENWV